MNQLDETGPLPLNGFVHPIFEGIHLDGLLRRSTMYASTPHSPTGTARGESLY
jgi:hypothetical protein